MLVPLSAIKNFSDHLMVGVCQMALEKKLVTIHKLALSNGKSSFFNH
jgi:hypothetical protein